MPSLPDPLLLDIAAYARDHVIDSELAYDTARLSLMDALACGLQALAQPDCTRLLGPIVPGATMVSGARVPGTSYELDPVRAAFNIGAMIHWLGADQGHPSDNLGGILAVADYLSRQAVAGGGAAPTVRDLLTAMIKAHEIHEVIALDKANAQTAVDPVILVRLTSSAVTTAMLGGTVEQVIDAVSNAWLDGGAPRAERHAPDVGSSSSWASGDATSRGVWHALNAVRGERGHSSALSARRPGYCDVLREARRLAHARPCGSYAVENVLFMVGHPAELHGQTAVECALQLHAAVVDRLDQVERVLIETQAQAMRIIDRTGPLDCPADRYRCIRYLTAIPLIFGRLQVEDYADCVARDPRLEALRSRMIVSENPGFSRDYQSADTRAAANAVQVMFSDGSASPRVQIDFPIGHRRRRAEGSLLVLQKFDRAAAEAFPDQQYHRVRSLFDDPGRLDRLRVDQLMAELVRN
jgi:2-methylcitrate dehydratase